MDARERYFWDLTGHLIVRNVLSPEEIDQINNALGYVIESGAIDQGEDLGVSAYGEGGRAFVGVDPEIYLPGVRGKHRMLRTLEWKLVYIPDGEAGMYRLYHLATDPGETLDVAKENPEILMKMRSDLARIMEVEAGQTIPEAGLTEEEKEQLRALGYL